MKYFLITGLLALGAVTVQPATSGSTIPGYAMPVRTVPRPATSPANDGFAVIKGHVTNNTDGFWEFARTDYFGNSIVSVPIDKNGDFTKTIPVEGNAADVYLYLNDDAITTYVQKNDTIEINWDARAFDKTFTIKSRNPERNRDLQMMWTLYKSYRKESLSLMMSLYKDGLTDSVKYAKINDFYNRQIDTLLAGGVYPGTDIMATRIYYSCVKMMNGHRLLPAYDLFIRDPSDKSGLVRSLGVAKRYRVESEKDFANSCDYRDFLFDYVRFNAPDTAAKDSAERRSAAEKHAGSFPWQDYYAGKHYLKSDELRDWFLTRSVIFDFQFYTFEDATAVYKEYIKTPHIAFYTDSLTKFYADVQRLKPGNPAPVFSLKGENGSAVSLTDFRGKVVYIDFWGVGCGPCVYDIKNSVPALHEKYKDKNIVFLNICVDSKEKEWKEALSNFHLTGVNLLAEGYTKNPACMAYGVNGIPHYYLIDKEGKIVDNNSPRPSDSQLAALLDKVLSK